MKSKAFIFMPALFCLLAISCAPREAGDKTLQLYVHSQNVYREGHFAEAAAMLKTEKKFVPALVLRGKAEYLSGDMAAAEKTLKRALGLNHENTEASLFLARLYRERGGKKEALRITEKILSGNPQDIRTLRFAAELAREKGAAGEAASAALLNRAVEASSESALVFLDRARQRWAGGNGPGALEDLGRAKVLLSHDSPVLKAVETLESIISGVSS